MSKGVETESEGSRNEVEDPSRCGCGPQSSLDDYLPGPDRPEKNLGSEKQYHQGHARRARNGEVRVSGEVRQRKDPEVGSDGIRCRLLDRKSGEYPCFHCPGGRDVSECERIRRLKK
uniref:Uncharacterized protein n=1 Tax=uncultured microorganism TaxID=358574 RepID=I2FJI0_9ZZZZ|nr:hypothetical protein [uncultured microorganism]